MNKEALPSIGDDLAPRKRVDLKSIKSADVDDAAVAENSRKLGTEWGAQTSLRRNPKTFESVGTALRLQNSRVAPKSWSTCFWDSP